MGDNKSFVNLINSAMYKTEKSHAEMYAFDVGGIDCGKEPKFGNLPIIKIDTDNYLRCEYCNSKVKSEMIICTQCGATL